jgi:hypothetical protein
MPGIAAIAFDICASSAAYCCQMQAAEAVVHDTEHAQLLSALAHAHGTCGLQTMGRTWQHASYTCLLSGSRRLPEADATRQARSAHHAILIGRICFLRTVGAAATCKHVG